MWSHSFFLPHFSDIYITLFSDADCNLFLATVQPMRGINLLSLFYKPWSNSKSNHKLANGLGEQPLSLSPIWKFLSSTEKLHYEESVPCSLLAPIASKYRRSSWTIVAKWSFEYRTFSASWPVPEGLENRQENTGEAAIVAEGIGSGTKGIFPVLLLKSPSESALTCDVIKGAETSQRNFMRPSEQPYFFPADWK